MEPQVGRLLSSRSEKKVLCPAVEVSCVNLRVLQNKNFLKESVNTTDCGQLSQKDGIHFVV